MCTVFRLFLFDLALALAPPHDECFRYQWMALNVSVGSESTCDDFDYCRHLYHAPNGSMVYYTGSIEAGDWTRVSCETAFDSLNSMRPLLDPADPTETAMPELVWAPYTAMTWAGENDAAWRRFSRRENIRTLEDSVAFHAWNRQAYDPLVQSMMEVLEEEVLLIARSIVASFPRVAFRHSVHGEILARIENRDMTAAAKFRNSPGMRLYAWAVRAMLELGLKQPRSGYLAAIVPFVHAFCHLQYRFGLDYVGLFDSVQDIVATLVEIHPRYTSLPWHMRLPMQYRDDWKLPEYPIMARADFNWRLLLQDAGIARASDRVSIYSLLRQRLVNLMIGLVRDPDREYGPLQEEIAVLFLVADRTGEDVSSLCQRFRQAVESTFTNAADTTLRVSVLGRCKDDMALNVRLQFVDVIASEVDNIERTRMLIDPAHPASSLLAHLGVIDIRALGGQLVLSMIRSDHNDTTVPGGTIPWLGSMIEFLFSTSMLVRIEDGDCTRYRPSATALAMPMHIRSIGRLFALYLREGNAGNLLGRYLRACGEDDTVQRVLFMNSAAIRNGFYDLFAPADFEVALIDGQDAADMLAFASDNKPAFFALGHGSVRTQ